MIRLNMILMLVATICALGVITAQHKGRKLFQALEAEQERARQLEIEYGQLQLELSTWATPPRIEKIAREKLFMRTPEAVAKLGEKSPPVIQVPAARPIAPPDKGRRL